MNASHWLEISLAVALIGGLAWSLTRLLSSHSAQTRHAIWMLAVVAFAIVIPAKFFLIGWTIDLPVLHHALSTRSGEPTRFERTGDDPARDDEGIELWQPHTADHSLQTTPPSIAIESQRTAVAPPGSMPARTMHLRFPEFSITNWIGCLYVSGFLLSLSRIIVAWAHLRQLAKRSIEINESEARLATQCCRALSVPQIPTIRVSVDVETAMAFGLWHPVVLLPVSFCTWPESRQRSVLTHELAHVARRDALSELFSRIVVAVYWFHPVVHLTLRALRHEREEATDECVVMSGIDAIEYGRHLITVLSEIRCQRHYAGAITMTGYGRTKRRLERITRMDTKIPNRSSAPCWFGLTAFLLISLTTIRWIDAQDPARQVPERTPNAPVTSTLPVKPTLPGKSTLQVESEQRSLYESIMAAELSEDRDSDVSLTVRGLVTDSQGKAVAGAAVALRQTTSTALRIAGSITPFRDLFARTTTDASGQFEFVDVEPPKVRSRRQQNWDLISASARGDVGWHHLNVEESESKVQLTADVQLRPVADISGRLIDPDGHAITSAKARIEWIDQPSPEEPFFHQSPELMLLSDSSIAPACETDAQGRFTLTGIPQDMVAGVSLHHPDWCTTYGAIRTSEAVKLGPRFPDRDLGSRDPPVRASGSTFQADAGILVHGMVTDTVGKPVFNCLVTFSGNGLMATTDVSGRFTSRLFPDAFDRRRSTTPDAIRVSVYPQDLSTVLLSARQLYTRQQATQDEPISFVLEHGVTVGGKVITSAGDPVDGISVSAFPIKWIDLPYDRRDLNPVFLGATTEHDGSYQLLVPQGAEYRLYASSDLQEFSIPKRISSSRIETWGPSQRITVPGNLAEDSSVLAPPIVVTRRSSLSVRCVDPQGSPVSGVSVRLLHRIPPVGKSWTRDTELTDNVKTDDKGQAILRPSRMIATNVIVQAQIDENEHHFWVESPLPTDALRRETVVRLKPMWRVSGRVTVDGNPMQGAGVMIWREYTDGSLRSHSVGGEPVLSDEQGNYVKFVPPNGSYHALYWSLHDRCNPNAKFEVTRIGPGEYRVEEIQFITAHGTISGLVSGRDGTPIGGASVRASPRFPGSNKMLLANPSPNTRNTVTDERGRFTIEGLPDGAYSVSAFYRTKLKTRKDLKHAGTRAHTGDTDIRLTLSEVTVLADE